MIKLNPKQVEIIIKRMRRCEPIADPGERLAVYLADVEDVIKEMGK